MILPAEDLQAIDSLRHLNLNLQAYDRAKSFGEFSKWEGTEALITASSLAFNLGSPDAAVRLTSRAWHRDKSHPRATFMFAGDLMQTRGPLAALIFMRRYPEFQADDVLMSWWYSLRGELHAALRDFGAAEHFHELAVAACPEEGWVWTARSFTLEQQDRYEEALDSARKGLELAPTRRSCVSAVAHLLTLLESNDEALKLLTEAAGKVENGWMLKEIADLQSEQGMYRESYSTLQKCKEHFPLLEKKTGEWLYGALSDGAYLTGDLENAIVYAEKASNPFHKTIAENLKSADMTSKRVVLDVRFLRQHHVTCAPATLSNIARYWKKKAEHLELVEEMCYDGTPSYKERIWAEANGWIAKEFTLNWEDATSMIDRGVPLTLATVYPGGGHLQAIIGYDARRKTYLIRDPYFPRISEFISDELIKNQKASGPRVMALVPTESSMLLDGTPGQLSESEIYDLQYKAESALEHHKREEAGAALSELESRYPSHRLTNVAKWAISAYDVNGLGIRSALQELLKEFPDDVNLRLSEISVSSEFIGRVERMDTLERYSRATPTDPLIWQMFGYELSIDAKQHRRALHWLWKSIRKAQTNALSFRLVADVLWSQRKFEEAAELYRIASSLNDKDEQLAFSYFLAMWNLKREDEAIAVLSDRVKRFGKQSGMPIRSLFSALRELGRVDEALNELDAAVRLRPDDGDLFLFAADVKARYGQTAEADKLLDAAKGRASNSNWLRGAAHIARLKGEPETALANWREILKDNPVNIEAHENVALLLRGLEGSTAAKDHMRRSCRKYPTNRSLQVLRLQHLTEEPSEAIAVLRDLIRRDPGDVWSLRELSGWYSQVGKLDRAIEVTEQAVTISPNDAVSHWFHGRVLELLKKFSEAGEAYRAAISINVDYVPSLASWLGISRSIEAKRAVLDFFWQELNKQVTTGDGLFAYREEARRVIDRPSLLKMLEEYAAANRRSWFAASAVIQQLSELGRTDEAIELALESTKRFPLVHQTWLDLSAVYQLAGDSSNEIEALRTAVSINPVWSYGMQQLTAAYQRAGRLEDARTFLLEALARLPFDNFLLGYLADVYWGLGKRSDAIQTAKRAIEIEPDYAWAWNAIKQWAEQTGDPQMPVELARELTRKKPKDLRAWINLADMLDTGAVSSERMAAVEQALKIDPFSPTALAMKANFLADERRFDEAIEVARSKTPDGYRPEQLRFAEAGIEATRGNTARCEDILVELTETSPGYFPGWLRLADVYGSDPSRQHEYRKAAMELVRLAPREAPSFGYLAEACLKLDLKDEAIDALEQAVILDPAYEYAVTALFELLLEKDDLIAAEAHVAAILISFPPTGLPLEVELAAKKNDAPRVLESLRKTLQNPDVSEARLDRVFERLDELFKKDSSELLDLLGKVSATEGANPATGKFLIDQAWRKKKEKACNEALDSVSGNPKLWAKAASRFMEKISGGNGRALLKFIDANAEKLKSQNESWSSVGYHLTNMDDSTRLSRWFEGWETRQDLAPWMLWNYSVTIRRNGQADEADRINIAALSLRYDDTVNMHLTMLGLRALKRGAVDEGTRYFSETNPRAMSNWDRFFYDSLNEIIWAHQRLASGDTDDAKALADSIVDRLIAFDPQGSDKMTKDLVVGPLDQLLDAIGNKWFSFRKKAKLMYYRFG